MSDKFSSVSVFCFTVTICMGQINLRAFMLKMPRGRINSIGRQIKKHDHTVLLFLRFKSKVWNTYSFAHG